ncbi:MAG TPA: Gldg family protein [Phycisphaerales bacterium]|nr:Gldg family protein [Phycisphaerales bacterium]
MRRAGLIGGIIALIVLFFAVNMLATAGLRNTRLDLTQGKVFTLTQGSRNIAAGIEEPVTLTFYYSSKLAQGTPQVQTYARRVRELLEEYVRISGGNIKLSVVDPEPNSEAEDEAIAAGVTGVPVGPGKSLYLGLVGTNTTDGREVIPFLSPDPSKERFLEYDVSRMLYALNNPKKKVVGLITPLQMSGGFTFDQRTRQPVRTPSWQIAEQIRGTFELRQLSGTQKEIPADINVLMVAHPKNLDDQTLFAIDQYVLKGGRLVAFVDPFCESDESAGQDPTARFSEFTKLLDTWGVEVVRGQIAADKSLAKIVMYGNQQRPERVTYVPWIGLTREQLTKDDPVTGQLNTVNFASSGFIRAKADAAPAEGQAPASKPKATIAPLASTTAGAWEMPVMELAMPTGPDPKAMLEHYQAGTQPLVVAARLSGEVETAFPNGLPAAGETPAVPAGVQKGPLNVILVADADLLSDNQWIRVQNFFGQNLGTKLADNADFVINALENMSGSSDLIGVRAKPSEQRPFDLVQKMQREAEEKYAAEQKALNLKLQDTVRKLEELQAKRGSDDNNLVLTPEQQKVLDDLRVEHASTRKQLRRVEHGLSQDIETLGMKLRLINIALIPALVTVGALGLAGFRAARRRRKA